MKAVVALDAFKGCVSSARAGAAARAGVLAVEPDADVRVVPVADGGEGTVDAILHAQCGQRVVAATVDALGASSTCSYALLDDGTALIEAASCVGLDLVGRVDSTLPPRASSAGLGLLIRHAIGLGARRVAVALGGTSCTDGGVGMLISLGAQVRDDHGRLIPAAGANPLWAIGTAPHVHLPDLGGVELLVLTDVDNPLHGPHGAAHVYAPQKGATADQVRFLDRRLAAWGAALAAADRPVESAAGAGAAGGAGAALLALGARRQSGFEFVARTAGLATEMTGADLVITGEGRVDSQTGCGKAPAGVAALAREAGAIVVALAGSVARGTPGPFDAVFAVHSGPVSLEEALDPGTATESIAATAGEVARLVGAGLRHRRRDPCTATARTP